MKNIIGAKRVWLSSNNKFNGTQAMNWITSFNIYKDTETVVLTDNILTAHLINALLVNVPIIAFNDISNSYRIRKVLETTTIKNIIFIIRVQDQNQKLDYMIEKLFAELLHNNNYDISFKVINNKDDIYREDLLLPTHLKKIA